MCARSILYKKENQIRLKWSVRNSSRLMQEVILGLELKCHNLTRYSKSKKSKTLKILIRSRGSWLRVSRARKPKKACSWARTKLEKAITWITTTRSLKGRIRKIMSFRTRHTWIKILGPPSTRVKAGLNPKRSPWSRIFRNSKNNSLKMWTSTLPNSQAKP